MRHALCGDQRCLHDESEARAGGDDRVGSLDAHCIEISTRFGSVSANLVVLANLTIFDVRRISDDDIEAAAYHYAVEFDEPVERLMTSLPLRKGVGFLLRL